MDPPDSDIKVISDIIAWVMLSAMLLFGSLVAKNLMLSAGIYELSAGISLILVLDVTLML